MISSAIGEVALASKLRNRGINERREIIVSGSRHQGHSQERRGRGRGRGEKREG